MAEIVRISSGAPWEPIFGYSRAVKVGPWVLVSGTTAIADGGRVAGVGQMYVQARQAISNIAAALDRVGATLADVVRTRTYLTDMGRFEEVARAHREAFAAAPPAATAVEVGRLVHPDLLVEIEAEALVESVPSPPAPARTKTTASTRKAAPKAKPRAARKAPSRRKRRR